MPDNSPIISSSGAPQIMGILNVTPDSFSDGGQYMEVQRAMDRIHIMLENGASIIDIGGESTRPGADPVSEQEEADRVMPVLERAVDTFSDAIFSVDTTKYSVAREALRIGASIINDVSGLQKEPRLAEVCAEFEATYILMHTQGDPKTMQQNPEYDDVVDDVSAFLQKQIITLQEKGVHSIVLDPGIGFGKTTEHNLRLIAHLDKFQKFGFPLLIGASRKSVIGSVLDGRPADDRLTGTIALHYHAMMKGARILRVHDVREAYDSIRIFQALQSQQ